MSDSQSDLSRVFGDQQDLGQMQAALDAAAEGVTPEQVVAIQQFIERIGGFQNARDALELLARLDDEAA